MLERNNRVGRDSREINGQDIRGTDKDVARAYNEHWFGDKPTELSRRTSMIVDPSDGRMPALTPEAQIGRLNRFRISDLHPLSECHALGGVTGQTRP